MVTAIICLALAPSQAVGESGGKVALGLNLGVDLPSGDGSLGPGGVWHLALELAPSKRLSLALEIGTAANEIDADRTVVVYGVPRRVSLHAVSTLGVLTRYSLRAGRVRPYLAGGANYYTSWDDIRPTATQGGGTVTRSGLGIQAGTGSAFWLGGRWDLYAEGLYHLATKDSDDARYLAIQAGLRFFLGRRRSNP